MLLVTTSHSLLRVDPGSGLFEPVHRGKGLYYGIASDGRRWIVAARGRTPSSEQKAEDERGVLLVFDERLQLVDTWTAPFALRDMHEILWHDGKLWVTCSYDNMIAIHDPSAGHWERWYPLGNIESPPYDRNHLNSLAVFGGTLFIVAHNWGDSELLAFDLATRELRSRTPFGIQSHNVRDVAGTLTTCSSGEGDLIDAAGWRLHVGGFTRGLLLTASHRYVGISTLAERNERDFTDGRIAVYDGDWRHVRTLLLPREGLVLDLQRCRDAVES